MKVTAQDVAQLLANSPPRQIPAHVAKAAQGGGAAWFLPLFGFVFFAFGMVFAAFFFPWRFLDDWRLSSNAARTAKGTIVSVRDTNMSINKVRVVDYEFRYTAGGGPQRRGHCYTTGQAWPANREVTVRYLPTQPDLACLEGARLDKVGWSGAFVVIFPLVGAGFGISFLFNRRNVRRLLLSGHVTEVDVISVDRTHTRINNRYVYKISVRSPGLLNGQPFTIRRTEPGEIELAQKRVADQQSIYVLYDPTNPRRLLFPEALIGR